MSENYGSLSGAATEVFEEKKALEFTKSGVTLKYLCSQHPEHESVPLSVEITFEWYEVYLISKGHPPKVFCHSGCDVSGKISKLEAHRALEAALVSGLIRDDYLCEVLMRGANLPDRATKEVNGAINEIRAEIGE